MTLMEQQLVNIIGNVARVADLVNQLSTTVLVVGIFNMLLMLFLYYRLRHLIEELLKDQKERNRW